MRDKSGNMIHIGETITLAEKTRPKRLIGRQGVVTGLGDVRIHVHLLAQKYGKTEDIRVEPAYVLVGEHKISNPMLDDPILQSLIKDMLAEHVESILSVGVAKNIISSQQLKLLLPLFVKA